MAVIEDLDEEERYLLAIMLDPSGLDLAELTWYEPENEDGCWRAWPFQVSWWRDTSPLQVDQCSRSVGKTLSISVRMYAFPFLYPGQEAVITAPELIHLEPITSLVERRFDETRLGRYILPPAKSSVTHRPFQMNFVNGARIIGRIPQRTGAGVKGCEGENNPVWTSKGYKLAKDIRVGDLVLTHTGQYAPVTEVHYDVNDCFEVTGQGSFPVTVSCDHRFYGAMNTAGPKEKREFEALFWHDVNFLLEHQVHWASPTSFPSLPVPALDFMIGSSWFAQDNAEFWWIVGRYAADGYLSMDKKNNKARRVNWVIHPKDQQELVSVLDALGLHYSITERSHSSADVVSVASSPLYRWLAEHVGQHAEGKRLPPFILGNQFREAFLDGYLSGDGHWNASRERWEAGTASKEFAMGLQLLAQSVGFVVNCSQVQPKVSEIRGRQLVKQPMVSYRLQIKVAGLQHRIGDYVVGRVKSVVSVGEQPIVNIVVAGDHSYLGGSIMGHNIHPLWLEQDEGQDYPGPGWTELIETLKRGSVGATWRVHGVTRGMRDKFYEITQDAPDNPWKIHRITAMHRPTWTDQERQEKLSQYGSRDHPDYRRNVLGLHGDATNPIFVIHRLMACVDDDLSSDYNNDEYLSLRVNHEMLVDRGQDRDIIEFLDFPQRMKQHKVTWIGMDVGMTNHPSEILVFSEYHKPKQEKSTLKLICRVHLERISNPQQERAIIWMMDFFQPQGFSLDKTGLGLPLFQDLQERAPQVANQIKGYNFSSKILVDFDDSVELHEGDDDVKKAGIEKNVLEYSTDLMRALVDDRRLELPWDTQLLGEFQGQTWTYDRSAMDLYGRRRRVFSQGTFHALDAARMAVLGWKQATIEEMLRLRAQQDDNPVFDTFFNPADFNF